MYLKYVAKMDLILMLSKFSNQIVGSPSVLCSIQKFDRSGRVNGKRPMTIYIRILISPTDSNQQTHAWAVRSRCVYIGIATCSKFVKLESKIIVFDMIRF